jgi:hypothetical protein
MLKSGNPPNDWNALVKAARKPSKQQLGSY